MKVKVKKAYVGRNSARLHEVGEIQEWDTPGKYGQALINNGFVEVLKEGEEWTPKTGRAYWTVSDFGEVEDYVWDGDEVDNRFQKCGNLFKSGEEAARLANWLKAVKVLRRDSDKSVGNKKVEQPAFVWNCCGSLKASHLYGESLANPFPFESEKDAARSIKKHEQEWLTFFKFMNN